MLVATRDPPPNPGARGGAHSDGVARPAGVEPRMARIVTVLQVAGSLLAIPVGLTSAYTLYRANFSSESTCNTLRANILATLDKGVDATTRRALVRRDVEAFERSCGMADPEANAAFKSLIAAHPAPAPAAKSPAVPAVKAASSSSAGATRQPAVQETPAAANSDVVWVAAVRRALLAQPHQPETRADIPVAVPPSAAQPLSLDAASVNAERSAVTAPAATAPALPPATTAPALPPATAVATVPAPATEAEHPVPPETIPVPTIANDVPAAAPAEQKRSRIGGWISHVPLLNKMIGSDRP